MAKTPPRGQKAAAPSTPVDNNWDPTAFQPDMNNDPPPPEMFKGHPPDDPAVALHGEFEAGAHQTDNFEQDHSGTPAEPDRTFDEEAWNQDTDNTHQDGGNGFHQEHFISGEDLAKLPENQPGAIQATIARHDSEPISLLPGDIARRLNEANPGATHDVLAPANRDETIVGEHPLWEKGLRPPAPVNDIQRTDDAGRPFNGGYLHAEDKGYPPGMAVNEHVPAPTATGGAPEGLRTGYTAPVPVGYQRDDKRLEERQKKVGDQLTLAPRHHALLDAAEDLQSKGAKEFTLAQVGGAGHTAEELANAGFLSKSESTSGYFFPQSGTIYTLAGG